MMGMSLQSRLTRTTNCSLCGKKWKIGSVGVNRGQPQKILENWAKEYQEDGRGCGLKRVSLVYDENSGSEK